MAWHACGPHALISGVFMRTESVRITTLILILNRLFLIPFSHAGSGSRNFIAININARVHVFTSPGEFVFININASAAASDQYFDTVLSHMI